MARVAIVHAEADAALANALRARLHALGHTSVAHGSQAEAMLALATPAFERDREAMATALAGAQAGVRLGLIDLGARRDLLAQGAWIGWDLEGLEPLLGAPPAAETLRLRVRFLADKLLRLCGENYIPSPDASMERLLLLERFLHTRLRIVSQDLAAPLQPFAQAAAAKPSPPAAQPVARVSAPGRVQPGRVFQALVEVDLPDAENARARQRVQVHLETARAGPSGSMVQRASGRAGETLRFRFRLRAGRGRPGRSLLRLTLESEGRRLGEVSWPLEITPEAPAKPEPQPQGRFRAHLPAL
jgi:hypothetical protein